MKKNIKKIINVVLMIAGIIALIGVGGLFINGTFMGVILLKYLPLLVHQVVGYVLAGVGILSGIVYAFESFK